MDDKTRNIIIAVIVALLVLGGIYFVWQENNKPGKLDSFAQCLKDKGAVFYGTFWCPHCQNTKKLFESSEKYLPYVECSTSDGKGQLQICKDKKISGYPTWLFEQGFTVESSTAPHKCTDEAGESAICKNYYNKDYGVWVFPNEIVGSETDPVQKDGTWVFGPNARLSGELSLETLSQKTGCELPK